MAIRRLITDSITNNRPENKLPPQSEWAVPQGVLRYNGVREELYQALIEYASRLTLPASTHSLRIFTDRKLSSEEQRAAVDIIATRTAVCFDPPKPQ